ncbi:MAG: hypothetical protein ACRC8K_17370, partial [Waterburya sp.]
MQLVSLYPKNFDMAEGVVSLIIAIALKNNAQITQQKHSILFLLSKMFKSRTFHVSYYALFTITSQQRPIFNR